MIDFSSEFERDLEPLLDLLVDGELNEARRRELLSRLDVEPDGWRRCALAFVEAQDFHRELNCLIGREATWRQNGSPVSTVGRIFNPSEHTDGLKIHPTTTPIQSRKNRFLRLLTVVATLVMAFGLGWIVRGPEEAKPQAAAMPLALNHVDQDPSSNDQRFENAQPLQSDSNGPAAPIKVVGLLTWNIDEGGKTKAIAVPVIEGPGIDEEWLRRQPPAVSQAALQTLERNGHKVAANRQLLTVNLNNGRRLIVPIDQLEVQFKNRVYQ